MASNPPVCKCSLKLGIHQINTQHKENNNILEEVGNQNIDFLGPANSFERTKIQNKIDELKDQISEYYYDKKSKVIALPNLTLLPQSPRVLGNSKMDLHYVNQNCEEILHQQIVATARKLKLECFIMMGFQSEDCLKFLYEQASKARKKDRFAELNEFEKKIQGILDIEDISKKDLDLCIENHKKWRKDQKCFEDDSSSELFHKE